MMVSTFVRSVLVLALLAGLAACGKRGAPTPEGPASEITYPRTYPAR